MIVVVCTELNQMIHDTYTVYNILVIINLPKLKMKHSNSLGCFYLFIF